jgi:hypothetical protein
MTSTSDEPHANGSGGHGTGLFNRMARCVELDEGVDSPVTAELLSCLKLLGHAATATETSVGGAHSGTVPSNAGPKAPEGPAALFPTRFGRFELRGILGTGGFGVVFRAFDPELDREIALKIPRPDIAALPGLQSRFLREAQAAAALDHPGIVPVFETGRIGPIVYISTALCCGPSLADWLTVCRKTLPPSQAAELVRQLAQAVQHAHDRGVLHRDLKPSNVLLEPRAPQRVSGQAHFAPKTPHDHRRDGARPVPENEPVPDGNQLSDY